MLRLTIEVVPWGIESRKRKVGEVEITNLTGAGPVADYGVRIFTCEGFTRQLVHTSVGRNVARENATYISTAISCASNALMEAVHHYGPKLREKLRWRLAQCGEESESKGEEA